jgi:transcriptional regulator with XRE-family HTH domain
MTHTVFPKVLKEARTYYKITQKQTAEALGITERAYRHYELGTREPDIRTLIAIADRFNVSLDFLTGRTCKQVWFDHDKQVYIVDDKSFSLLD